MSSTETVDAVVVGMGPGGEAVASDLAEAGLDVVGIDAHLLGGECPYWGCVPTKMMVRAAHALAEARRVPVLAGDATVRPDWGTVASRIRDDATDGWDDSVAVERFEDRGGRFVRGHGRLVAPDVVAVGELRFRARRAVVLATGSRPAVPPVPGLRETPYWTNRQAVQARSRPGSLLVLGGGAIGVELAQVFCRFGTKVTVVEAADRLVPMEEPEASALLAEVFSDEAIGVSTGVAADEVTHDGERFTVRLADDRALTAERLLVATGRRVDLGAVGAEVLGIDPDGRHLPVDEHLRVAGGVWAVGDITGQGNFTHVAAYQARIAVADILGEPHAPAEYHALPRVTFTDPEIGAVGMTEQAAIDAGLDVGTGITRVPATARGWIHKAGNEGFVKLVVDRARGALVGATAAGPSGGEVLGLLTLAVHARVPVDQLRTMIYAYPTFHRGIEDALRDLR